LTYTDRLDDLGAAPSVGSKGDAYDNAMAEAWVATFKRASSSTAAASRATSTPSIHIPEGRRPRLALHHDVVALLEPIAQTSTARRPLRGSLDGREKQHRERKLVAAEVSRWQKQEEDAAHPWPGPRSSGRKRR
jgi:hypothetical protein